jgi:hypothetical protein
VAPSLHVQQYKAHERSRESIELAFDSILQKKYKLRHKYGFRPPATGRKTDLAADEEVLTPSVQPAMQSGLGSIASCSCSGAVQSSLQALCRHQVDFLSSSVSRDMTCNSAPAAAQPFAAGEGGAGAFSSRDHHRERRLHLPRAGRVVRGSFRSGGSKCAKRNDRPVGCWLRARAA